MSGQFSVFHVWLDALKWTEKTPNTSEHSNLWTKQKVPLIKIQEPISTSGVWKAAQKKEDVML